MFTKIHVSVLFCSTFLIYRLVRLFTVLSFAFVFAEVSGVDLLPEFDLSVCFFLTFTVTLQIYFFFLIFAITLAFPFFFAFTIPFWETEIICGLFTDHLHFFLVPFSFNFTFVPVYMVILVLFNLLFEFALVFQGVSMENNMSKLKQDKIIRFIFSILLLVKIAILVKPSRNTIIKLDRKYRTVVCISRSYANGISTWEI